MHHSVLRKWFGGLFALCAACGPALGQNSPVHNQMLESAVYIECLIEFQGAALMTGTGTGFLVGAGDKVVTNDHVINSCHPDNRIGVLARTLFSQTEERVKRDGKYPEEFQTSVRALDQTTRERLYADTAFARKQFVAWNEATSVAWAKSNFSGATQKLSIVVMGKSTREPVHIDVARILWSRQDNERARETGLDLAVLALVRPLTDRPTVTFATGSSARVSDQIFAVGFPVASGNVVPSAKYIPTMKRGIVSKLGGESPELTEEAAKKGLKGVQVIEVDAAISPGNSGGPLYNEYGEVMGINSFVSAKGGAYGWAVDIDAVLPVLQDLGIPTTVRRAPRSWLELNRVLASSIAGGLVCVLLAVTAALVMRRRRVPSAPASASASAPVPAPAARAPAARANGAPAAEAVDATLVTPPSAWHVAGLSGTHGGKRIAFGSELVFGRDPARCNMLFPKTLKDVSGCHCALQWDPVAGAIVLRDLGSSNGTFVHDQRLEAHTSLRMKAGDQFYLSKPEHRFELRSGPA